MTRRRFSRSRSSTILRATSSASTQGPAPSPRAAELAAAKPVADVVLGDAQNVGGVDCSGARHLGAPGCLPVHDEPRRARCPVVAEVGVFALQRGGEDEFEVSAARDALALAVELVDESAIEAHADRVA